MYLVCTLGECLLEGIGNIMLTRNVGCTLRPISATYKRRIRDVYTGPTRLNQAARIALAQAIFTVENDTEHRLGTHHPQVMAMTAVRNILLDEAGENEPLGDYPQQDSTRALMAERRRKGNPNNFRKGNE